MVRLLEFMVDDVELAEPYFKQLATLLVENDLLAWPLKVLATLEVVTVQSRCTFQVNVVAGMLPFFSDDFEFERKADLGWMLCSLNPDECSSECMLACNARWQS